MRAGCARWRSWWRAAIAALVVGLLAMPARAAEGRERRPGDRMVAAGVGVLCGGVAAYALLAAGLALGNRAEQDLTPLVEQADIERRRDLIARGRLGNRLAIAGAVVAAVAMGVGIPLVVIGRRRHQASLAIHPSPAGGALSLRVRF